MPTAALRNLKGLTFLDLAQNNLRTIGVGALNGLDSLTALNLERNVIQRLDPLVFMGVNNSLSSLSLLNNLLTEFPLQALGSLKELRVRLNYLVRSLFSVPKRQNPVFQGSLQMPECFWNASSFARPRNGRIMVQQIKCQNPVGWFKMQKS